MTANLAHSLAPHATSTFGVEIDSFTPAMAVVRPHGDIDMLTAPALTEALEKVDACTEILLDLSDVTFLSSAGIEVVVTAHTHRGEHLRVFAPTNPARRVLDLFAPDIAE